VSDEELLESLERHFFLMGNAGLTRTQFDEHASRGSCVQCDGIAQAAVAASRASAVT
jgi:hypothetical protein